MGKTASAVVSLHKGAPTAANDATYDAKAQIRSSHTSELVIALCGPIGSPLHKVAAAFKEALDGKFGYEHCLILRLSKLIEEHQGKAVSGPAFARTKELIEKGDALREKHGSAILAELAVSEIVLERQRFKASSEAPTFQPRRICHIIDSVKNQEELDLLRLVYRDMLYFVGVFAPLPARVKSLEHKGMSSGEIHNLIDQDSGEEIAHGQTVRDTFPNADCFLRIDVDSDSQIAARVERFLHVILGTQVITPTAAETAMYFAASAAGNSACLSRQVGAAITDANDEVIAVGWNDVPKAGGNLYMADPKNDPQSTHDLRCWNLEGGTCFNDQEKKLISELLVEELAKVGVVSDQHKSLALDTIAKNSKVKSLIEFSRSVHAEMHAIINAGKLSSGSPENGKMYVTTYPCHNCARHIVAAGVKEVYYIEPYRKSLATKLHSDAITEEESDVAKVRILPYDGIAPLRYLKLFRVPPDSRKSGGKLIKVEPQSATPRFDKTLEALPTLEAMVVKGLREKNLLPTEVS
ncbi:MAG: anti-phage dCTP deaminase [Alphaproteobacteria bacterium]